MTTWHDAECLSFSKSIVPNFSRVASICGRVFTEASCMNHANLHFHDSGVPSIVSCPADPKNSQGHLCANGRAVGVHGHNLRKVTLLR